MSQQWHELLSGMFVLGVPWIEKILRPIIVYLFLILGLRIAGKRELAQLNPFDLVVLLTLSNTVQNAIIGHDDSVLGGIIGATTLLALNWVVVRLLYRHRKLSQVVEGRPDILVRHGKVIHEHLKRELITFEELRAAAHKQGIASMHDVECAMLEPSGTISFITRHPTPASERHGELMEAIDELRALMREVRPKAS